MAEAQIAFWNLYIRECVSQSNTLMLYKCLVIPLTVYFDTVYMIATNVVLHEQQLLMSACWSILWSNNFVSTNLTLETLRFL